MIKFISYDGKYPNLCSGTLCFKKDEIEYKKQYAICSTGGLMADYSGTYSGPWVLDKEDFPELNEMELCYLTKLVNDNVQLGCCGGCI